MKKRVLMIHQGADNYGSDKIFRLSVETLCEHYDVNVLLDSTGPLIKHLEKLSVGSIIVRNVAVLRKVSISGFFSLCCYICTFFSSLFYLIMLQRRNKYDIVYVNTLAVISPLFVRLFFPKVKIIHHIHEIQCTPKFVFKTLYSLSYLFSSRVLGVSKSVISNAEEMNIFKSKNYKMKILYNGIPRVTEDNVDDNGFEDIFTIAMVGRIHHWKGQIELLDIMKEVKRKVGPCFKIVFAGGVFPGYEYLLNEFLTKIETLKLDDVVVYLGEVPNASRLFLASDITLMPSTSPDPLPTVVLEAMSCGSPVVSYAHGGATEMVENNETGILVEVKNQKLFSDAIVNLIENRAFLEKLSENSLIRYKSMFSLERYKNDLKGILDEI